MRKEKKGHKPLSIKFYIFSTMLALTIVMLVILWFMQSFFVSGIYRITKESDARRTSNLVGENIDSSEVYSLISQLAIEYDFCIMVVGFDEKADIIHDKHFTSDCLLHSVSDYSTLFDNWYKKAQENDNLYTEIMPRDRFRDFVYDDSDFEGNAPSVNNDSQNCLISTRIVENSKGEKLMVVINGSIEPLHSTLRATRIVLAMVSIIFFVFSLLISYALSRRVSRPIEEITIFAKNLECGHYDTRFAQKGPKEIRELSKTLNDTAIELDKTDKIRKELIANISHDLRTPLTMISGYSEVMRDLPGENTPENMQVIIDETARLTSLVNDMLDISKLQNGASPLNLQKINLTECVLDTVKRYDKLITHNGYKIDFVYNQEVFVMADKTRLLQVIYNLVNNAINYTGEDKRVVVHQDVLDDTVRISIVDTGEGISEENLPLIWDRYYKVDKVHKRAVLGTGLGLSIVKNILILHGSRFGVSSEVSKGSTFWFEFKIV